MTEAAKKVGICVTTLSNALKGRLKSAAGFHWLFLEDYNEQEEIVYDDKPIKKPVICMTTGEKFSSISEAARAVGCAADNIAQVVNGHRQTACGLRWKYADAENPPEEFYKDPRKKPIICLETGIIFQSIVEAAKSVGLKRGNSISAVLKSRQKKAAGLRWKYADAENPPEEFYKDPRKKPVICLETGIIFQSIVEAAKSVGLKHGNSISAVLKSRQKKAAGLRWKYADAENIPKDFHKDSRKKPIICLETGTVFQSISETAKSVGAKSSSGISSALLGKRKTAAGLHWEYWKEND